RGGGRRGHGRPAPGQLPRRPGGRGDVGGRGGGVGWGAVRVGGGAGGGADAGAAPPRGFRNATFLYCRFMNVAFLNFPGPPRHMLRRYCPPTSKNASVSCPSEHTRAALISSSKTLPSPAATSCSRRIASV